jgi:hypothetical protein
MKRNESTILTITALLKGDEVSALRGGELKTTRVANIINRLRDDGLLIETEKIKTGSGKWYGRYRLVDWSANREKAERLVERYKGIVPKNESVGHSV